jgi:predicted nucleic acid-binding protein
LPWMPPDSEIIISDTSCLILLTKIGELDLLRKFGLLLRAKQEGIIDRVKPILDKAAATNFRFSQKLFDELIKLSGE